MIKLQTSNTRRRTTRIRADVSQYFKFALFLYFAVFIEYHYNVCNAKPIVANKGNKNNPTMTDKDEKHNLKQQKRQVKGTNKRATTQHLDKILTEEEKTNDKITITAPTQVKENGNKNSRTKSSDTENKKYKDNNDTNNNNDKSCSEEDMDDKEQSFNQPPSPTIATPDNKNDINSQQPQQAHLLRHEINEQTEDQISKTKKTTNQDQITKIINEARLKNKNDKNFLEWSKTKLGVITSNIKIDYFYYNTTDRSLSNNSEINDDLLDENEVVIEPIRGLAATKNISIGEKILSIPFQSTITISTIHNDPVLSIILTEYSPNFKQQQESEINATNIEDNNEDDNRYSELYQLIIYLLYQRSLGRASVIKPYIDILLKTPYDTIPFLWSTEKLNAIYPDKNHIVRITTDTILNDIQEMYDDHIPTLIELYPEIFANKHSNTDDEASNWMFSLQNFKWAYFILNSRHWHLPCQDLDDLLQNLPDTTHASYDNSMQHVLIVPVADLINFGPACTKALYNSTTHAFEIIATCNITKDSEITFWYTNDCKDIVYANFGFTHELIPSCPTIQDYKERHSRLVHKLKDLQDELVHSWEYVEQLKLVIVEMQRLLEECDCDTTTNSEDTIAKTNPDTMIEKNKIPTVKTTTAKKQSNHNNINHDDSQKLRGEKITTASDIMDDVGL